MARPAWPWPQAVGTVGGAPGTGGRVRRVGGPDATSTIQDTGAAEPGPEVTSATICADSDGQYTGGTCAFDCTTQGTCTQVVTCPRNQPCRVDCGASGCAAGVDCSQGSTCTITCGQTGQPDACAGQVKCGGTQCTVTCDGGNACRGGVTSVASSTQMTCAGADSCAQPVTCAGNQCNVTCTGGGANNCGAGVNCNSGGGTCP